MSTLKTNKITTTAGVEVYTAKAWVNFNGGGTVAIRAAGNVSSITDNGTGDYTVNFATAMVDANYCISGIGHNKPATYTRNMQSVGTLLTTSCRVVTDDITGKYDIEQVCLTVIR